jgi:DNA repair exonuclease SbcCD ATPase subunit
VSGLREKTRQLEEKLDALLVEREEERDNLKNEIDYVTHSNQELEELLQEKEDFIE